VGEGGKLRMERSMQKDKFLSYLQELKKLVSKANFEVDLIENLQKQIKDLELIVPVIGGFSAGKSSLINSFLGSEILPVKITPETALSTELRYSNKNYIEAIKKDNSIETFDISLMSEIKNNARNYQYIKLYLNNQNLKDIEPLILVDMPGFDSPIELHNQAIMNYLNKGVYFIILNSIEDGVIPKSILREIDNIVEFNKDFTFCISKTNLKPGEIIKEVKNTIQEQLEVEFDYNKDIVLLDDNSGSNLDKILKSININNLYRKIFLEELKSNYFQVESTFNTTIYSLKTTDEEIEKWINEIESSINKLQPTTRANTHRQPVPQAGGSLPKGEVHQGDPGVGRPRARDVLCHAGYCC
jgi:GTPase SAR1 family protein